MYLREDNTPYYVGKGSGLRWREKHNVGIPPKQRIKFVATELYEQDAFNLEVELIKKYGRKDLGTGILRNQTNGGDGASGIVKSEETRKKHSEFMRQNNQKRKQEGWTYPDEARKIISKMRKGKPKSKEHIEKVASSLNSRTEEEKLKWKQKIADKKIGKPRSEETKKKIRATLLARRKG